MATAIYLLYARDDRETAEGLSRKFEAAGLTCQLARPTWVGSRRRAAARDIAAARVVLIVESPHSQQDRSVRRDLARARRLGKPILPVPCRRAIAAPEPHSASSGRLNIALATAAALILLAWPHAISAPRDVPSAPPRAARSVDIVPKPDAHAEADTNAEAAAAYRHAVALMRGDGAPPDIPTAIEWYRKAAALGSAAAQCDLGILYASGLGVEQDIDTARDLFARAAAQGFTEAEFNLGALYADFATPQDDAEAAGWFQRAADHGDGEALYRLGLMVADHPGARPGAASSYMQQAADRGDRSAQEWLATRKPGL